MKAFEFEIAPEQVRDFLKKSLQTEHLSSAQESWIEGIPPQLPQTIFRTISDISNTYRGNSMVGYILSKKRK